MSATLTECLMHTPVPYRRAEESISTNLYKSHSILKDTIDIFTAVVLLRMMAIRIYSPVSSSGSTCRDPRLVERQYGRGDWTAYYGKTVSSGEQLFSSDSKSMIAGLLQ